MALKTLDSVITLLKSPGYSDTQVSEVIGIYSDGTTSLLANVERISGSSMSLTVNMAGVVHTVDVP